jgi:hypothetical protein
VPLVLLDNISPIMVIPEQAALLAMLVSMLHLQVQVHAPLARLELQQPTLENLLALLVSLESTVPLQVLQDALHVQQAPTTHLLVLLHHLLV